MFLFNTAYLDRSWGAVVLRVTEAWRAAGKEEHQLHISNLVGGVSLTVLRCLISHLVAFLALCTGVAFLFV